MPPKKKEESKGGAAKEAKASEVWDALISSSRSQGKQFGYAGDNHIASMFEEQAEEKKDEFPTQVVIGKSIEPLLAKVCMKSLVAVNYEGLKQLRFWGCGFGDLGVKFIAEGLRSLPGVKHLEIMDCLVSPKGCEYLASVLQNITQAQLRTLRLDCNNIGSTGAAVLSRGLSFNSCLKTLSLKHCNIEKEGGEAIGVLLATKVTAIETLEMEGNELGNDGIIALCAGLRSNDSLTDIDLSLTKFGGDTNAILALAAAFRTTPKLKWINLDGNLIGDEGLQTLLDNLADVKHIQFIDVTPFLSPEVLKLLHDYCDGNKPVAAGKGKKKGGKKKK